MDSNGNIVIPYGFSPGYKWKRDIDEYMLRLTDDIGCITFNREDQMSTSIYDNDAVF